MKRTTAEANDNNRYTEGNPALGVPATVVGAEEMNNLQEELANIVEDAGITLNGSDEDQALEAIKIIIKRGGDQTSFTVANNQSSAADVTGLVFDKATVKAAKVDFDLYRSTDSSNVREIGTLFISHDTIDDTWHIELASHHEDAGVVFSITAAGQVQYTSTNISGANYAGTLRYSNIKTFAL